jgi:hypothetical protein
MRIKSAIADRILTLFVVVSVVGVGLICAVIVALTVARYPIAESWYLFPFQVVWAGSASYALVVCLIFGSPVDLLSDQWGYAGSLWVIPVVVFVLVR